MMRGLELLRAELTPEQRSRVTLDEIDKKLRVHRIKLDRRTAGRIRARLIGEGSEVAPAKDNLSAVITAIEEAGGIGRTKELLETIERIRRIPR